MYPSKNCLSLFVFRNMFCSILHFKQLSLSNLYTNCHKNILLDSNQYNFCQKSKSLNQVKLVNDINLIHKYNTQLFIYTDTVQQSAFDLQILNYDVKVFVLFGLGANQSVSDSHVNVSLHFEVFQGALLCVQCNITVQRCTLVFTASGRQLSGLLIEANKLVDIQQSFIQFRFSGLNVSGIVNHVNITGANISICDCNLTGHNLISGGYSGYLSSLMSSVIMVHISEMNVCVDNIQQLGNQSISVTFNGSEVLRCDLCGLSKLIYGLCADALPHSQQLNGMWQCVLPFIYTNDQCVCAQGYALEDDVCVNITQSIRSSSQQINQLKQNVTDAQTELSKLDKSLEQNTSALKELVLASRSALEDYIKLNYSQLLLGWQTDVSALDGRIFGNATVLANDLKTSASALDKKLSQNSTELDWRIFNNVSALNASILDVQNDIAKLTSDSATFREEVTDNLTKIDSFVKQNMSSALNSLEQELIAVNTSVIEIAVKTTQLEYTTKYLKDVQDEMKSETQSLYDLSNQTRTIINTTSAQLQQYIIDNFSKADGNLLANTTNLDKRIFDNTTILKESIQVANNKLDTCNQNISQLNQKLTHSDQVIQHQQKLISDLDMLVQCLNNADQLNITGQCYLVKSDSMSCSQKVYYNSFDISIVTHIVTQVNYYTSEYVFDMNSMIQNAFIDVSDNLYINYVQPLFQSQSMYINIKIQIGTQTVIGGSLVVEPRYSITVNKMNIISKSGSELTVNTVSQLNIFTNSLTATNITNLLVNLSFAPSIGKITLINNINGVFNISGYQVLGKYVSTHSVAMIGLYIQANISVNQVNFKPNTYQVACDSSYLFQIVENCSTFVINNIAIVLGNKIYFLLLGTQESVFNFGGIVTCFSSNYTVIVINNIIFDSNQYLNTSFARSFGFLVGDINSNLTNVTIKNVCMKQNFTSATIQFDTIGIIGHNYGNLLIQQVSVTFTISGTVFQNFGIVGVQEQLSNYAEVINVSTSVNVNSTSGGGFGSIFGVLNALNSSVQSVHVVGGSISFATNIGGLIGFQYPNVNLTILDSNISQTTISGSQWVGGLIGQNANATIINSAVYHSNISGTGSLGGLIGYLFMNANAMNFTISQTNISGSGTVGGITGTSMSIFQINNSKIQFVRISSTGSFGIVVGLNDGGTQIVIGSQSNSNSINDILYLDCPVLLSAWFVGGC
ncbi:halomucin [Hexamita inflata]|uniref:Halomucin n=1 Tax=Hexamita inflata TaxID=28002 RepID=A0AA86PTY7_9EUKA|nr:halomucin [Hexamita inflata]